MITFPTLGAIGRLGNHLFQMAATIGTALDHGDTFGFPKWSREGEFPVKDCFFGMLPDGPEYRESAFHYEPIPYRPNLRLHGFFQSEKHFIRHAETVRSLFTPLYAPPRDSYRGVASVHVRRGDYLLLPDFHPVLPPSFYEEAIARVKSLGASRFLIFSDDLEWCRSHFMEDPVFETAVDARDTVHLALMSACEYHIIANSTFSWWGAWLDPNPAKTVVAPKRWFGPGYAHYDTRDLLPECWLTL